MTNNCESAQTAKIYFPDKELADIRQIYEDLFGNIVLF